MLQQTLRFGRRCLRQGLLFAGSCALSAALSCAAPSSGVRTVKDITLRETRPSELDSSEALSGLTTARPRSFLWLVRERDAYDANLVARDLERIERFYRARGYYDVKVVAARIRAVGSHEVEVEIHVSPGPRVTLRSVKNDPRLLTLPGAVQLKLSAATELPRGRPFEEAELDRNTRRLEGVLKEAGYAYAKVRLRATVDLNAQAADVVMELEPGRAARFGAISLQGLKQIPESKVRAALGLRPGSPFSESALADAQEELQKLQVFSSVSVSPDLSDPEREEVPVLITVQEDKLRRLLLGGGTSLDALSLSAHLRTGWEHKNFLGGARKLSLEATPGVDFFPTRLESFDTLSRPTRALFTFDVVATLKQPSIFNGRTEAALAAKHSTFPLLYPLPVGANPSSEVIVGYHAPSGQVSLKRSFWSQRVQLEPSYNVQAKFPFAYQRGPAQGAQAVDQLETIWVSFPKLTAIFETRPGDIVRDDDKRDLALSLRNSVEVAGLKLGGTRLLGGSVSDVRIEPELRAQLPIVGKKTDARQLTGDLLLATRFKLGFVLLPDYGSSLRPRRAGATSDELKSVPVISDQQKLLFRAFYSGGGESNRGYAFRAISPHGTVGFLIPTGLNCVTMATDLGCIRPLGGFTQWEASLELRYSRFYPLTLVAFIDGSDVTRDVGVLNFRYPHLSAGPGVRYHTPVGPIRLDFGLRLPGLQALGQAELPIEHGQERPDVFGLPGAIHLAIGDAF